MKEKFTGGEWSISDINTENYGYSATIVSKDQMTTIAELKATTTSMVDWLPNTEGFRANLVLLKSAPKMYWLLVDISKSIDHCGDEIDVDFMKASINKLIAEARGESKDTD